MKHRRLFRSSAALLCAALLAPAATAHAAAGEGGHYLSMEGGTGSGFEKAINQIASLLILVPGVPLAFNTAENLLGDKGIGTMSKARKIFSYTVSGASIAAGATLIALQPDNAKSLIPAAILLGVGAFDLGLTLYRSRQRGAEGGTKVSMMPVGGADIRGNAFAGVGVAVSGF